MQVIKKWGNSLGVRIPARLAAQLEIRENSTVELSMAEGGLFVKPANSKPESSRCEMPDGITDKNPRKEIDSGEPRGTQIC